MTYAQLLAAMRRARDLQNELLVCKSVSRGTRAKPMPAEEQDQLDAEIRAAEAALDEEIDFSKVEYL